MLPSWSAHNLFSFPEIQLKPPCSPKCCAFSHPFSPTSSWHCSNTEFCLSFLPPRSHAVGAGQSRRTICCSAGASDSIPHACLNQLCQERADTALLFIAEEPHQHRYRTRTASSRFRTSRGIVLTRKVITMPSSISPPCVNGSRLASFNITSQFSLS